MRVLVCANCRATSDEKAEEDWFVVGRMSWMIMDHACSADCAGSIIEKIDNMKETPK